MSSADPASLLQKQVKVHALTGKPEFNSKIGKAESYLADRDRYLISFPPHISLSPVALKSDNLSIATFPEKCMAKVDEISGMAKTLYHDENVRDAVRTAYTNLQNKLPPNVKPEHALGVLVFLLLFTVYKLGLSKTLMLLSLVLMIGVVALPDLMQGRDAMSILRNFPMRWKDAIEQNTGYRPSRRIANAILVVTLMLSTKILITSTTQQNGNVPSSRAGKADYASSFANSNNNSNKDKGPSWTMEEVYKLGYQDAKDEKSFAESLPSNHANMIVQEAGAPPPSATPQYNLDDYSDYDEYAPPPPKKNNIGFGTIMALFTIGRTVKELGFVNGRFEWPLFQANVQQLPPLKIAFLGFMVYRLLSVFM